MNARWIWRGLNIATLVGAVVLGFGVWRAVKVRTHWAQTAEVRQRTLAKAASMRTGGARPDFASRPPASAAYVPTPEERIAAQELKAVAAEISRRRDRRNTLHSYLLGFERLQLAPDKLAQAKALILAEAEAAQKVLQQPRAGDEILAVVDSAEQALDRKLAEFLGTEAARALEASQRESSLNWTLGTAMWDGGAPLSAEQLRAIAVAEKTVGYKEPRMFLRGALLPAVDPQTGLSAQDTAFLDAAGRFLTTDQQRIMRDHLADENTYESGNRAFAERQRRLMETKP